MGSKYGWRRITTRPAPRHPATATTLFPEKTRADPRCRPLTSPHPGSIASKKQTAAIPENSYYFRRIFVMDFLAPTPSLPIPGPVELVTAKMLELQAKIDELLRVHIFDYIQ